MNVYQEIILMLAEWLEDEHLGMYEEARKEIMEKYGIDIAEWEV